MALGVWLHLTERHIHDHTHEPLSHAHPHTHDAHHQHSHGPRMIRRAISIPIPTFTTRSATVTRTSRTSTIVTGTLMYPRARSWGRGRRVAERPLEPMSPDERWDRQRAHPLDRH